MLLFECPSDLIDIITCWSPKLWELLLRALGAALLVYLRSFHSQPTKFIGGRRAKAVE
jgi:hypothetical protein